jgi:type II secretory pathway component GspD/PulD (secretin)
MTPTPPDSSALIWTSSLLAGLLIILTAWTSAWPQQPLPAGMSVAVHEGQLSVNLRETPVREVLAAIGQQAGLRMHVDATTNRMVSARFTNMALDQGLRRLLRAASLSYALQYAQTPSATVVLEEVRVFGEASGTTAASHDRAPREPPQRAVALSPYPPLEEPVAPAPDAAVEQQAEPEDAEPEQDGDATQE